MSNAKAFRRHPRGRMGLASSQINRMRGAIRVLPYHARSAPMRRHGNEQCTQSGGEAGRYHQSSVIVVNHHIWGVNLPVPARFTTQSPGPVGEQSDRQ